MSDDPPDIEDDPGTADEWFARAILATIPLTILLVAIGAVSAVVTGLITFHVTIRGAITPQFLINVFVKPVVYAFGALAIGVYVLAAAKEWGLAPVQWVANAARNYNPPERDNE